MSVKAVTSLTNVLLSHASNHSTVVKSVVQRCIHELDDIAMGTKGSFEEMNTVTRESPHPYADDSNTEGHIKIPGSKVNRNFLFRV